MEWTWLFQARHDIILVLGLNIGRSMIKTEVNEAHHSPHVVAAYE